MFQQQHLRVRPSAAVARPIKRQSSPGGLHKLAFVTLWLFVFTIPWENLITLPAFGTAGRLAGVVAFGVGVLAALDSGRKPRICGIHAWMALFVLWGGLTYYWSVSPDVSRDELVTFLQLLGMVWLIAQFASELPQQQSLMLAYVTGTWVSAGGTLWSYLTGYSAHYNRFSAWGFNPGDLGLALALSLPMSLYLMTETKKPLVAWFCRLQVLAAIGAILLTAARGALIATVLSLMIVPLLVPKWTVGQRAALLVVACAGIASMPFLIPETSWKRLGTIGEEISHGTLNQRTSVWKAGFDVFREQPLGGVGINAYAPAVQRVLGTPVQPKSKNGPPDVVMLVAHNSFISILVEQGIVGLGIFLALLLSLFLRAFRFSGTLRSLYVISLITWSVGVMDLTWEFRKPSWLLFGLIAATPLARRITQVRGIATQYGSKHGLTRHPVNA